MTDSFASMRFGLSFPNFGYSDPQDLVRLAVTAEDAGWDGFFIWDHIVIQDGMPVVDPWVTLGAIAHATDRIRIGPMVVAMPRHRPWVVARQSVSLDRLSGGRFVLGVGIGFPPEPEFATFGDPVDARIRADMLDAGLAIVQGVWSEERYEFAGRHYQVEPTSFAPAPIQQPRIPIWVAGMLPNRRPLRRAARYDGVFPIKEDMSEVSVEDVRSAKSYIEGRREEDGPYDFVIGGPPKGADEYAELEAAGVTWYLAGPPMEGESLDTSVVWIGAGPAAYTIG